MKGWKCFWGLFLAVILFASCEKETTLVNYSFYFSEEDYTQPSEIADSEIRKFYTGLWEGFSKINANDLWQIYVDNRKYGPEDEKAVTRFLITLETVKRYEAQYRKEIEELEVHEGSSFHVKFVYRLSRDVPADHFTPEYSPVTLKEYSFELRYN
ncbi:MAG: hypothetical protein J5490_01880 [Bacteroidales bacterium]|nr:hypothetical protein [Bacteroidales bacterium]